MKGNTGRVVTMGRGHLFLHPRFDCTRSLKKRSLTTNRCIVTNVIHTHYTTMSLYCDFFRCGRGLFQVDSALIERTHRVGRVIWCKVNTMAFIFTKSQPNPVPECCRNHGYAPVRLTERRVSTGSNSRRYTTWSGIFDSASLSSVSPCIWKCCPCNYSAVHDWWVLPDASCQYSFPKCSLSITWRG